MLLQKAVIVDPYARSVVGRREYGQLAKVICMLTAAAAAALLCPTICPNLSLKQTAATGHTATVYACVRDATTAELGD